MVHDIMDERRAMARSGIKGTARLFWRGDVHQVRIGNASLRGIGLIDLTLDLAADDQVAFELSDGTILDAVVRWCGGPSAGLEIVGARPLLDLDKLIHDAPAENAAGAETETDTLRPQSEFGCTIA
jgi:hypothetical protein